MKLTLRTKLLAAFGILLVLNALVGGVAIIQAGRINDQAARIYSDDVVGIGEVAVLAQDTLLVRSKVPAHIHTTDPATKAALAADIARLDRSIDVALAAIHAGDPDREQEPLLHQFERAWDSYLALPARHSDDGVADRRFSAVTAEIQALIRSKADEARTVNTNNGTIYGTSRWLIVGATLASVLLGLGMGIFLARRIGNAVTQVARASLGLAHGDLDQQIAVHSGDELGQMADAFRAMVDYQQTMAAAADAIAAGDLSADVQPQSERDVLGMAFQRMVVNLRQLVAELQQGAHNLSGAGDEILTMASQQASGANEQSAAVAQTTATVHQVKASAEHAVQLVEVVTETARHANRIATDGVAAVKQATEGMATIGQRVQSIADNILALSEQGQQIGEIIATVNDLADQSNLLALNAAIEASRAGEQGKSFTVVANEIRTLAEQSKGATAQVRTILSDIQRATNVAVLATEQGTKGVDAGARVIDQAGRTIDELAEAIQQAAESAAQIAATVWQHSAGMEQIAAAMGNINQATTQNLAATRNTQQAAQHLTDLAGRLNGLIVQYQV